MIQTVTSLFFLETNLSLTFQGDFCVSMIGRAALRCKKRGVKRCAARAAQKKTCAAQRHTKWNSGEGAHFNSEYLARKSTWNCQKWNKVVANSQNLRSKANKNGPRDCSKVPKNRNNTDNRELQIENPQENATKLWLVSCKDCVHHADLQQPKRSSPSAEVELPMSR